MGADFVLHKRVPPQSGLGGGSGNAAAALRLCRRLWNAPLSDTDLHDIAASLGSDINFLLSGAVAAVCRGRGERIQPLTIQRPLWFVAVRPEEGNSTADVFRHSEVPSAGKELQPVCLALNHFKPRVLEQVIFNRLLPAARMLNPSMAALMDRLQHALQRPVFMSGSGSTVFIVADSRQAARFDQAAVRRVTGRSAWLLEVRPEPGGLSRELLLPG